MSCDSEKKFFLQKEEKKCGHYCYPSTTLNCCACMDMRPHVDKYPIYIDGRGWADEGLRDDGYCPICNPKNYSVWEERLRIQHIEKVEAQRLALLKQDAEENIAFVDKIRAAVDLKTT